MLETIKQWLKSEHDSKVSVPGNFISDNCFLKILMCKHQSTYIYNKANDLLIRVTYGNE